MCKHFCGVLIALLLGAPVLAQLPPVPFPLENPITEEKRVLGKILFWDEQLSSDDTVACGTCHSLARSGADARVGIHPGPDGIPGTQDDILGSPGIARADASGHYVTDGTFGLHPQVTGRSANPVVGAAYSPQLFWDGRAGSKFLNPENGSVSIVIGGALENQAIGPILSDVEMAREGRSWTDVIAKLESVQPLDFATDIPADMAQALALDPTYPDLFRSAFGDLQITAERIAFAIATYERTLIPDQTPWDLFQAGDTLAMTPEQIAGWDFFQGTTCTICHTPPLFTDNNFRNIGVRPFAEDIGRMGVTGVRTDRGRFKVPTLRGVGLKANYMHGGQFLNLSAVLDFYSPLSRSTFQDNLDPLLPTTIPPFIKSEVIDFMENALTDPRAAAEVFPFDRPVLHGGDGLMASLTFQADGSTLRWAPTSGAESFNVYRGKLSELADGGYGACVNHLDPLTGDTVFVDTTLPVETGGGLFYLVSRFDGLGIEQDLGTASNGVPRQPATPCR